MFICRAFVLFWLVIGRLLSYGGRCGLGIGHWLSIFIDSLHWISIKRVHINISFWWVGRLITLGGFLRGGGGAGARTGAMTRVAFFGARSAVGGLC